MEKFWKKIFFSIFFNIINAKCGQQSIFSDKITILSHKTIFGPVFSVISENLMEQFLRNFPKTVILGQNGHFLARLAKIGQNENFYQNRAVLFFTLIVPPTSCRVSEKSLKHIRTYKHTDKGDLIEPVAFARFK